MSMTSIHPESTTGEDCTFGAFAHVAAGATLGARVSVGANTSIPDAVTLGDDVFVGPNVSIANHTLPPGPDAPIVPTTVHARASIGAGAVLLPGVEIGESAVVGAGSVVTRSVPPYAIVRGAPARISGYVDRGGTHAITTDLTPAGEVAADEGDESWTRDTQVDGVTIHRFPVIRDLRGSLLAAEFEQFLPFLPRRFFLVFDVPGMEVRGQHAHRECHQFIMCLSGSVKVLADDGVRRQEVVLEANRSGIHLPPMTWGTQYGYSEGAILLVFASHEYDAADYIREYDEFRELRAADASAGR